MMTQQRGWLGSDIDRLYLLSCKGNKEESHGREWGMMPDYG